MYATGYNFRCRLLTTATKGRSWLLEQLFPTHHTFEETFWRSLFHFSWLLLYLDALFWPMLILPQLLLTVSLKETVLLLVKVITFLGQVKILLPGSWHRCLWGCPWRWGWPTCCCWWSGCCSWWRKQNKLTLLQPHWWRRRESNRGKRERDGLRTRNLAGTATAEWWLMMCIFSNIFISLFNIANLQSDRVITP